MKANRSNFKTVAAKNHSELVALHEMGFTDAELADRYSVTEYTVRRILAGKYIINTCPVCGIKFLATRGGKHCSAKCYRNYKDNMRGSVETPVGQQIAEKIKEGKTRKEIAAELGISTKTVISKIPKEQRGKAFGKKEKIIPFVIAGKSTNEIMQLTHSCKETVKRWQKYYESHPEEFSSRKVTSQPGFNDKVNALRASGLTVRETAEKLGVKPDTVKAHTAKEFRRSTESPHKAKIIELYLAGKTRNAIAHELGVSYPTVSKWIERYNAEKRIKAAAAQIETTPKQETPIAEISVPAKPRPKIVHFAKHKTFHKKQNIPAAIPAAMPATTPVLPVSAGNTMGLAKLPGYVAVVLWPMEHLAKLPEYIGAIA